MPRLFSALPLALVLIALPGCGSKDRNIPGDSDDRRPFAEIGAEEVLKLTGTEPFWGGEVAANRLTYTTPEKPEGTPVAVTRFAGRGGLSFSGKMDGQDLLLAVTPGTCSDGMSDRSYPFVATLQIGPEERSGCAWSRDHPYTSVPAEGSNEATP